MSFCMQSLKFFEFSSPNCSKESKFFLNSVFVLHTIDMKNVFQRGMTNIFFAKNYNSMNQNYENID